MLPTILSSVLEEIQSFVKRDSSFTRMLRVIPDMAQDQSNDTTHDFLAGKSARSIKVSLAKVKL